MSVFVTRLLKVWKAFSMVMSSVLCSSFEEFDLAVCFLYGGWSRLSDIGAISDWMGYRMIWSCFDMCVKDFR